MNEADLKRKLVREINDLPSAYARRIEDRWSVGALDVFIKLPEARAMWAECKVFDGNVFGPTKRQWVEGNRLLAANVPALLIGWRDKVMHVSQWVEQADRRECFTCSDCDYAMTLVKYRNEYLR